MKIFKFASFAFASAVALTAFSPIASAETISYFTSSVSPGSATQLGRLSRNGVQQDWTGQETVPATINAATTYYYHAYKFDSSLFAGAPYVDISITDDTSTGNFFVSAYANSYDPTNLQKNWLGDEGASNNFFSVDSRFFDIVLPTAGSLVLVVNTTTVGTAAQTAVSPYDIAINAYADTQFDEPVGGAPPVVAPTPEPSTLVMLGTGLLGAFGVARRRVTRA